MSAEFKPPKHILPLIVVSQFMCTSLWFAGNGVMADLISNFGLGPHALGHLTSAVQVGFIVGTLLFAILTITDRFSPSKVFMISAFFGALFNAGITWQGNSMESLLFLRFLTGFFLAGIYPVGMKIAADYYTKGLGRSLGFLVGALVIGTSFPHLLKGLTIAIPWRAVLLTTSGLAILGGSLIGAGVPNGPNRKSSQKLELSAFFDVFKNKNFRSAAFGYFGHMWELYAFWAFVPVLLMNYSQTHLEFDFNIPILSFLIISSGGLACVLSGYLSERAGKKRVAYVSLMLSGVCCVLSPWLLSQGSSYLLIAFLFFWGMTVVADSPLFSTLVAHNTPDEVKGTALTIVNCIGFSITIVSIQLINELQNVLQANHIYVLLAAGPILGLVALSGRAK